MLAYKQVVSEQLSNRPPIICCLPQTLSKGAPGEWIERPEVGQFTFHPVVCSDLARRIALLLELPLRPPEVTRTLREQTAEALAMLWECFQPAMHDRLNGLEHAILDLRSDSLSGKDRDSAAQQAGTLAGALEPFGFADAACLARDVERVLRAEGEVAPSESDLLCLLVVVLRAELDSATRSPAKAQISR